MLCYAMLCVLHNNGANGHVIECLFGLVWLLLFIRWAVELTELQKPKKEGNKTHVWNTEKMCRSSCFVASTIIQDNKKCFDVCMCDGSHLLTILFLNLTYILDWKNLVLCRLKHKLKSLHWRRPEAERERGR